MSCKRNSAQLLRELNSCKEEEDLVVVIIGMQGLGRGDNMAAMDLGID